MQLDIDIHKTLHGNGRRFELLAVLFERIKHDLRRREPIGNGFYNLTANGNLATFRDVVVLAKARVA